MVVRSLSIKSIVIRSVLIAAAALTAGCSIFGPNLGEYPTVVIDSGRLQGDLVDGVPVFRGIPYAAAPVDELRWRPPQPVKPWKRIYDATEYGPNCAQFDSPSLWFELGKVSEDCLTLNVWSAVQHRDRQAPVMVYIHGGGFSNGSGNIALLNSPAMARKDVLLVTINYRVSAFGFLTHPALAASHPDDPVGNYGLQDVVASLEWVQRNIAAFGGDPERVTIFGESAGANIVNMLMVMPAAEGLFQRAIAQSPSAGLAPMSYPDRRAGFLPPTNKTGEDFVDRLTFKKGKPEGVALAEALRKVDTDDLLEVLTDTDRFIPVVDGRVVPDQVGALYAAGKMHRVPLLIGSNSWEASLGREIGGGFSPEFSSRLMAQKDKERLYPELQGAALDDAIFGDLIIHSGIRYVANQMVRYDRPVYSYYLTYVATDRQRAGQPGAAHTDDIAFVFQTLDTEPDIKNVSFEDSKVSRLMNEYWVRFAKRGDPNNYGLPEWPAYERQNGAILDIGTEIEVREDLFAARMEYHIGRGEQLLEKAMQNPKQTAQAPASSEVAVAAAETDERTATVEPDAETAAGSAEQD